MSGNAVSSTPMLLLVHRMMHACLRLRSFCADCASLYLLSPRGSMPRPLQLQHALFLTANPDVLQARPMGAGSSPCPALLTPE